MPLSSRKTELSCIGSSVMNDLPGRNLRFSIDRGGTFTDVYAEVHKHVFNYGSLHGVVRLSSQQWWCSKVFPRPSFTVQYCTLTGFIFEMYSYHGCYLGSSVAFLVILCQGFSHVRDVPLLNLKCIISGA